MRAENPAQAQGIDGISRWIGMRWDSADTVRVEIRPELINAAGLLSGAVTYAQVDYCMGSTLWRETAGDEGIATVSIAINYVATATEGEIVCRTTLDRRNRRLATAIGSFTIFPRRNA
ncbi:MAG: PaaI family thioesterase [Thermoleophilaceae bacterium]|nr:PaaI family thioesterase [Thermoleophilaceae bacterium]